MAKSKEIFTGGLTFGERLRFSRKKKGLSQAGLAKKIGFKTSASVSNAEFNKTPVDNTTLEKIAKILDVDLHWLITGKSSPHTKEMTNLFIDATKKFAPYLGDHLARLLEQKVELLEKRDALLAISNPAEQDRTELSQANSDLDKLIEFTKETLYVLNWLHDPFEKDKEQLKKVQKYGESAKK